MGSRVILTGSSVITMNTAQPRAGAIAVDSDSGRIVAVGSLADC